MAFLCDTPLCVSAKFSDETILKALYGLFEENLVKQIVKTDEDHKKICFVPNCCENDLFWKFIFSLNDTERPIYIHGQDGKWWYSTEVEKLEGKFTRIYIRYYIALHHGCVCFWKFIECLTFPIMFPLSFCIKWDE